MTLAYTLFSKSRFCIFRLVSNQTRVRKVRNGKINLQHRLLLSIFFECESKPKEAQHGKVYHMARHYRACPRCWHSHTPFFFSSLKRKKSTLVIQDMYLKYKRRRTEWQQLLIAGHLNQRFIMILNSHIPSSQKFANYYFRSVIDDQTLTLPIYPKKKKKTLTIPSRDAHSYEDCCR